MEPTHQPTSGTAPLRDRIRGGFPVISFLLTLPSTVSAEKVAGIGFDFLWVDLQHGQLDYRDALAVITAINAQGGIAFVRPPSNEPGLIGRLLDAGARGIIVPMVNDADEARAAVAACRYAPLGQRSYGPLYIGPDPTVVNNDISCVVMIETTEGLANADSIARVEGLDAIMAGPSDLAISVGLRPGAADGAPEFETTLTRIRDAAAAAGIGAGMPCAPASVGQRFAEGYSLFNVGGDLGEIVAGASRYLASFHDLTAKGAPADEVPSNEGRLMADA
jgi:4-hydroxy-2-oxoheptanedioate aldolase